MANFAYADMVGYIGNLQATIAAIECLDTCLGQIIDALQKFGGPILLTADHGNAEVMWDNERNQPHTAHATNLVPLLYFGDSKPNSRLTRCGPPFF